MAFSEPLASSVRSGGADQSYEEFEATLDSLTPPSGKVCFSIISIVGPILMILGILALTGHLPKVGYPGAVAMTVIGSIFSVERIFDLACCCFALAKPTKNKPQLGH